LPRPSTAILGAFAVAWVALVQGDSLLLGPLARPEWGDGEQLFTGYFPYLARAQGTFLHDLAGGVDAQAVGRIGGEFLSTRRALAGALPLWVSIVGLRVLVAVVAMAGVWLFATRVLDCPRPAAMALAALHAVGWDFTATLTFLYGLSLAAIPLLLYLLFTGTGRLRDWTAWLVAVLAYVSLADPIYWLPAVWLAAAATATWCRPASLRFAALGLAALTIAWLANYAEALHAFLTLLPHSGVAYTASPCGDSM
jgi:hypothetical protein